MLGHRLHWFKILCVIGAHHPIFLINTVNQWACQWYRFKSTRPAYAWRFVVRCLFYSTARNTFNGTATLIRRQSTSYGLCGWRLTPAHPFSSGANEVRGLMIQHWVNVSDWCHIMHHASDVRVCGLYVWWCTPVPLLGSGANGRVDWSQTAEYMCCLAAGYSGTSIRQRR